MSEPQEIVSFLLNEHARLKPYAHQIIGVEKLIERAYFGLFDEMGAGKTKQAIDAAQVLFTLGKIDRVLVIVPAPVRPNWFDREIGELAKHLWHSIANDVAEFHTKSREWSSTKVGTLRPDARLSWIVTNYEFLRSKNRMTQLKAYCGPRTMLILDESTAVKNHQSQQTIACLTLRRHCARVVLMNGTPIANNPADMFSQGNMMHPSILSCDSWFHYRARYAEMVKMPVGKIDQKTKKKREVSIISGWVNLTDLQQRFKPHVLRRLKIDCLDLPPKLPPVTLSVPLSLESWRLYKQMRDELVSWLDDGSVAIAEQAMTRVIRLSQITSGFLAGVEQAVDDNTEGPGIREIGTEKLDYLLEWLDERWFEDPTLKILVWCRFRWELARLVTAAKARWPDLPVAPVHGGQKASERDYALKLLHPDTAPQGPALAIGTLGTGSLGLNFTASHIAVNLSHDYSLYKFMQGADRIHRPGQTHPVSYFDFVATGPTGQKTIDHAVIKALRTKDDVATWTTSAWVSILREQAESDAA